MSVMEQFSNILNGIEDESLKSELTSAFNGVKGSFNDAIASRDKVRAINSDLKKKLGGVKELIGAESDDFSVDDIKEFIESSKQSTNETLEDALAKQKAKFEADTEELRKVISEKEQLTEQFKTKYENLEFNTMIEQEGLLKGFNTDNSRVKTMLIEEFKARLIKDNDRFLVKDNATGEPQRDLKTGEYLSPKMIREMMLNSEEWSPFVKPETVANGSGTPPQNSNFSSGKKFSDYSSAELVQMRRTNPQKYDLLKSQQ